MSDFVALALSTAGEPGDSAEIFELAATRVTGKTTSERFSTLLRTRAVLPYRVRVMAGLEASDFATAVSADQAASELKQFVRDSVVIVEQAGPALEALARLEVEPPGPVYDLTELAGLLIPGLAPYDVSSVATRLGLAMPAAGRAAARAEAMALVFAQLRDRAAMLNPLLLHELAQITSNTSWSLRFFFRDLADSRTGARLAGNIALEQIGDHDWLPAATDFGPPLAQLVQRVPVDPDEITAAFKCAVEADGAAGFEQRPQQVAMATAVVSAFEDDHHLIVEAGTGTGKSLAYLLPAAFFALRNNGRVVVSTNTINLQEQIAGKDIPALRRLIANCGPDDLRGRADDLKATVLKGRGNYVCLQKLALLRGSKIWTEAEARFAVRVLLWLGQGGVGDRSELRLPPDEEPLWNRVSAEGTNCLTARNQYVRNGQCLLLRARKRAEAAHLVVVNHALLLSDIATGAHVLPTNDRLVVDEAHNLEDEATEQFGFHSGQGEIAAFLNAIFERGRERELGLVADLRQAVRGAGGDSGQSGYFAGLLTQAGEIVERARERLPETFDRLRAFVHQHGEAGGDYDNRMLLTMGKRAQPEWEQVELAWENLRLDLLQVEASLERVRVALEGSDGQSILEEERLAAALAAHQVTGSLLRKGIEAIIDRHDGSRIAWLSVNRNNGSVVLASAPLDVAEVLDSYLFSRKASVVVTSATLSTSGSFAYVRDRLGLAEAEELALGSPFNYRRAALLLLPADMPEPTYPQYQRAMEDLVAELCTASEGRALVLFTSHGSLRATYRAVRPRLAAEQIRVLAQGIDGTPPELLRSLRTLPRVVLFGTSSFWEGVDVVGEALSLLVIAKLPFSVPSDPVFAARSELFDEPFMEYALPQAILRFKQGFGRLVRHHQDRGVIAVLDRRLRSKQYGKAFLQSLPDCTVEELPSSRLGAAVRDWLERGTAPAPDSKR